jgi:predicted aspartyl protease
VEFPPAVSSVPLPTRFSDGKFIVRVMIAGRGLDFLLDTGAAGIVINRDIAEQLHLEEHGAYSNAANAGRYVGTSAIVPEMTIGSLTMRDVVVTTVPDVDEGRPGLYKVVGLLGFDFIDAVGLKLDYQAGTVTALTPDAFAVPTDPRTIDLDIRLGSLQPETSLVVNGSLGEHFMLDTGASGGLMLFDYFQRRHPEALSEKERLPINPNLHFVGVGGDFDVRPYRLHSVRLGKVNFADFVALAVESSKSYGGDQDGLIGTELLSLFTLYTDYPAGKIYLAPNDLMNRAMSN